MAEEHILCEFNMIQDAANVVSRAHGTNGLLENIALESFLLHIRQVRDFFYGVRKNKWPDDTFASDYASNWESVQPDLPRVIKEHEERLDRQLAHLSYARLRYKGKEKEWPVDEMATAMAEVVRVFLRSLPQDRAAWFSGVRL